MSVGSTPFLVLLTAALASLALTGAAAQQAADRVHVRRIEFDGASGINDEVLRRELLQLEGAVLNTVAVEESVRRLRALPYVQRADVSLRPVDGAVNLVDLVISIEQAPARYYGGGGGYSRSQRASLNAYYADVNFLGTGQRLSFEVEGSELRSAVEASHAEPWARPPGVSRTVTLASRRVERLAAHASRLDAAVTSARLEYAFPLSAPRPAAPAGVAAAPRGRVDGAAGRAEIRPYTDILQSLYGSRCCQSVRVGLDLRDVELAPGPAAADQLLDWITRNGDPQTGGTAPSTSFVGADLLLGWRQDTRERGLFPERGVEQTLSLRAALAGSEVEYFTLDYEAGWYRPVGERWTARLRGRLGYGAARGGETTSLPPYLNYFAGGPGSVRGYRENGLGPKDSRGNAYGGNLLLAGQLELMAAWPPRWRERMRVGAFFDIGNVFSTENVAFTDSTGARLDYGFDWSALRASVGVAADVAIPLGTLRLSYAEPLDARTGHPDPILNDAVERFQISIGVGF